MQDDDISLYIVKSVKQHANMDTTTFYVDGRRGKTRELIRALAMAIVALDVFYVEFLTKLCGFFQSVHAKLLKMTADKQQEVGSEEVGSKT